MSKHTYYIVVYKSIPNWKRNYTNSKPVIHNEIRDYVKTTF
jgi:hypothetical protein